MTVDQYNKQIEEYNNLIKGYRDKLAEIFVKREIQQEIENGQIKLEGL